MVGLLPPRTLAVDPLHRHVNDEARGHLSHRVLLPRTKVGLGQVVHHLERAALRDPGAALYDQLGMKPLAGVLLGLEREDDPRIAP